MWFSGLGTLGLQKDTGQKKALREPFEDNRFSKPARARGYRTPTWALPRSTTVSQESDGEPSILDFTTPYILEEVVPKSGHFKPLSSKGSPIKSENIRKLTLEPNLIENYLNLTANLTIVVPTFS